ncbi:MAG: hypothetical protein WC455_09935 [Dehalococcoidia bacterium]
MKYVIEVHEHGLLVRTVSAPGLPIEDMSAITKMAEAMGYTHLHIGIASSLGAHSAYVSEESGKKWRKEIDDKARRDHGDSVAAWLAGADTGLSSKALACRLSGIPYAERDHPWDPDDIGRCFRFLDRFPELKSHLYIMKDVSPVWERLVDHWDELRALWDEESPTGKGPKLYNRMKELITDGA